MCIWIERPPPEFFEDRDVWKEHHHPLSDDESVAREAMNAAKTCRTRMGRSAVRKSTKAPCPQPKRRSPRHSVYERSLRPIRTMVSPVSYVGQSDSSDDESGVGGMVDTREWVDAVNGETIIALAITTHGVVGDRQLASYRKETARDPENVLRSLTTYNMGGLVIDHDDDHSGYSSNDWAKHLYGRDLSSSKQPPVRPAGPLDPAYPWI
ncbi:hypothetical protein BD626DRAFT_494362 [Schizophyllum amplum]|uniref:Uncharacterized protein n=1 Tax=Schizophyllum amplum TaxID=97359 RepID=A0A550CF73_9AGAR|nr:hypothetical protein BD626DRAFT_494362 [Auriculariopsis ampla]